MFSGWYCLKLFELDVTVPYIVSVILEADVAFPVFTEFFKFAELAVGDHFFPVAGTQVIFQHIFTVLPVNHRALVNQDLTLVPFSIGLGILRISRDQVI